jgi:FAD/FMN-containing dehydrogenase
MKRISRRQLLAAGAVGAALLSQARQGRSAPGAPKPQPVTLNDASRLNPTPVAHNITVPVSDDRRIVAELRSVLKEAAADKRPLCMGGARHSMGGQSLPRDGFATALTAVTIEPDTQNRQYRVRAGTRWRDVIAALDPLGFSVAVMQSNSDFSVGGTLSVNAHGWPVRYGPFCSTVKSFRLLLADGSLVTCSRSENEELFRLVVGGYGLFGIIVDADVEMVENTQMLPTFAVMPAASVADRFIMAATEPGVRMAYGRLSVAREDFLQQGFVVSYRPAAALGKRPPTAQRNKAYSFVSRTLFRSQIGSERGKSARWYAETVLLPRAANRPITRNSILSYPVSVLAETDPRRTDILHEYFLPADRFEDFLKACRMLIPPSQDLLNVTLRYVDADKDALLAFAPAPRIAAVMLFNYAATQDADMAMQQMTEQLIDAVLALGGSFYLPYRLHARAIRSGRPIRGSTNSSPRSGSTIRGCGSAI